jgi:DNA helicase-2/ATP-dependent DNA helicase PcrA
VKRTVIFGPPGCGKTHRLAEIVGQFLKARQGRVLFTSHTKAAAQTALERVGLNPRIDTSTLHSYCFRELGMSRAQTVDDQKLEEVMGEFGLDCEDGGDGRRYQEVMSHAACTGKPVLESYELLGSPGTRTHFTAFEKSYRRWKETNGFLDFDDMLLKFLTQRRGSGHALLMIDEAQDMTPLHWKVVKQFILLNPRCAIVIAGDDDQCLYAYAGADPHGMAQFAEEYKARVHTLTQSYRVPQTVHGVAQRIAARMARRKEKEYAPTTEVGNIQGFGSFSTNRLGDAQRDTLILYNDKFVRKEVEGELIDAGIAFTATGGFPAPLQTKGARAVYSAMGDTPDGGVVRKGLNERGVDLFNAAGIGAIVEKIRRGDHSIVNFGNNEWLVGDYYSRVDWSRPPKVRISTIHGAKGMEADDVHLLLDQSQAALDYGFRDPDASHRLFYVAVTRARHNLSTYEGENGYDLPKH